jgi:hypothetical protein
MKNIPTKMFEYWACGRAVIASDLPPIKPFFSDRKNGLLFSATDPESLARAIQYTIEHTEETERMGRLAHVRRRGRIRRRQGTGRAAAQQHATDEGRAEEPGEGWALWVLRLHVFAGIIFSPDFPLAGILAVRRPLLPSGRAEVNAALSEQTNRRPLPDLGRY